MERTFTPLLFLAATGLSAQPTIPQVSFTAGDQLVVDIAFPITKAGPGGPNTTWNFGGAAFSGAEWHYTAMAAAGTPYAADLPDATIALFAETPQGFNLYSYLSTNGGFTEHGEIAIEDGVEYPSIHSDPLTFFTTPLTASGSGSDTYVSVDVLPGWSTSTITGTHNWTVDGHGTLILPNATYTDVLRIHAVQEETMSLDIGGITIDFESSREEWRWVKAGIPLPLLVFSLETDDFETEIGATTALVSYNGAVGIHDRAGQQPLRLYPNPAHDVLHLEQEARGTVEYRVLDALGREVLQGSTAAGGTLRHGIDVGALQVGAYLVEVHGATGLGTARFIKQ